MPACESSPLSATAPKTGVTLAGRDFLSSRGEKLRDALEAGREGRLPPWTSRRIRSISLATLFTARCYFYNASSPHEAFGEAQRKGANNKAIKSKARKNTAARYRINELEKAPRVWTEHKGYSSSIIR